MRQPTRYVASLISMFGLALTCSDCGSSGKLCGQSQCDGAILDGSAVRDGASEAADQSEPSDRATDAYDRDAPVADDADAGIQADAIDGAGDVDELPPNPTCCYNTVSHACVVGCIGVVNCYCTSNFCLLCGSDGGLPACPGHIDEAGGKACDNVNVTCTYTNQGKCTCLSSGDGGSQSSSPPTWQCAPRSCYGIMCAAGETCMDGECTCPSGLTDCAGVCVNAKRDPSNCGVCGTTCSGSQLCRDGKCSDM